RILSVLYETQESCGGDARAARWPRARGVADTSRAACAPPDGRLSGMGKNGAGGRAVTRGAKWPQSGGDAWRRAAAPGRVGASRLAFSVPTVSNQNHPWMTQ